MDSIGKMQTGLGLSLANALTFGFFALKDSLPILGYIAFGLIYLAIGFGWRLESLNHAKREEAGLENSRYDQGTALLWTVTGILFFLIAVWSIPSTETNPLTNPWFVLSGTTSLACFSKVAQIVLRFN